MLRKTFKLSSLANLKHLYKLKWQIENEYNAVRLAYKEDGERYIEWAANLVESMNLGIPWVMCKQDNAPGNIINACNGRHCGDTFPGPKRPDMPSLWTENWTTQYVCNLFFCNNKYVCIRACISQFSSSLSHRLKTIYIICYIFLQVSSFWGSSNK